jgi:2-keto-4-pentenoate hydratase/2-oxohepta-3-ene-1,7-dioic acid hydratase in catechol pathway
MKLAMFTHRGNTSVGKVVGDRVIDLRAVGDVADDIVSLIAAMRRDSVLRESVETLESPGYLLADVVLNAPVPHPGKFLAIGMNYREHADEARRAGVKVPDSQLWFNKQVTSVTGPFDPVHYPHVVKELDYEAELGVVIGARCRYASSDEALSAVAGYLVINDVSARDWQARSPTFTLGKSFDTHGPTGPWVTTADEIGDPQDLQLRLTVNGIVRQQASTRSMIYSVAEQISYLSQVMTLMPGDLLATGTPAGVGIAMTPPSLLSIGDVVRVEVDKIGFIENRIVAEPDAVRRLDTANPAGD